MFPNTRQTDLQKWIFAALLAAAGVLLSPVFSFPLGVSRAFPLQHMINIFLAVLCGTRYGVRRFYDFADPEYHRLRFAFGFSRFYDRGFSFGISLQAYR